MKQPFCPRPLRRRQPCKALRAVPIANAGDIRVTGYRLLPARLPNSNPRLTRFVGEAVVRVGDLSCLADVVKISDIPCLETDLFAWDRRGRRVPVAWPDGRMAVLLRQIEGCHLLATGRAYAAGEGRN